MGVFPGLAMEIGLGWEEGILKHSLTVAAGSLAQARKATQVCVQLLGQVL